MYQLFSVFFFYILWAMNPWNDMVFAQKTPTVFGNPPIYSSHHEINDLHTLSRRARKKWINNKVREMKSATWDKNLEFAEFISISTDDIKLNKVRISACNKLSFDNKDTILICTHSIHENPLIGDVSIALLNRKKVYVNFGHVCGGLIHFESPRIPNPENGAQFFSQYVSDTDELKWEKWRFPSWCFVF
ncbi:hypothetical protein BH23THE1_BH23THE1_36120 [soil metagenome]